jgi:predicted hydrocarbon binding protein
METMKSMNLASTPFDHDQTRGIVHLAMEEILASDGVERILKAEGGLEAVSVEKAQNGGSEFSDFRIDSLQTALVRSFGANAGRGLSLRVGRSCFKYLLRTHGLEPAINDQALRFSSLRTRWKMGMEAFAAFFKCFTDQNIKWVEVQQNVEWKIEFFTASGEIQPEEVVCMLAVGFLQEELEWISPGRYFRVEEVSCQALGDPRCTILIHRIPVDS